MHSTRHWYDLGNLRPPGLLKLALEARLGWEYAATLAARPALANLSFKVVPLAKCFSVNPTFRQNGYDHMVAYCHNLFQLS